MDINVDTAVFERLLWQLRDNKSKMEETLSTFEKYMREAGKHWQGDLYEIAQDVIVAFRKAIDVTEENIEKMRDYITRLNEHVDKYLSCQYEG